MAMSRAAARSAPPRRARRAAAASTPLAAGGGGVSPARARAPRPRVVLLHGKGGAGAEFAASLAPLCRLLPGARWEAPDAPLRLSPSSEERAAFAWWAAAGGGRSYEADAWAGGDAALAAAAAACEGAQLVLGHSQGAMLLGVLLAQRRLGGVECAILSGAAWPRPYASSVEANVVERLHPTRGKLYTGPAILHTLSRRDAVNPYAQGVQLAAALGGDIMEHGGGHVVPVRDLGGEIADWVRAHSAADYGVPV